LDRAGASQEAKEITPASQVVVDLAQRKEPRMVLAGDNVAVSGRKEEVWYRTDK